MNNPTLYHYTKVNGLLGIISNCELWSSDCRFLNDGSELTYAREIFFNEIAQLNLPTRKDDLGYRIPGNSLDDFQIYITCFCEEGDLLSQWRAYGKEQGYSLGFDSNLLKDLENVEVFPVQYGIKNPQEYFSRELQEASQLSEHPGISEWHQSQWILPRLAQVKNPSFAEEREWRLIVQLDHYKNISNENVNIKFRTSPLGPISYVVNSFPKECLREIIIGPGPNSTICEQSVHSLLDVYEFNKVIVRVSNIPYRN